MQVQFECSNTTAAALGGKPAPKPGPNDPVKFRIVPVSCLVARVDLKDRPVPATDWKTSDAPMLRKAARSSIRRQAAATTKRCSAERRFETEAIRFRGDRRLNFFERNLVAVWSGRPKEDVIKTMGAPLRQSESGNVRTLSYSKAFDRTAVVANMKRGAVFETGPYSRCDMDFLSLRDGAKGWRVADVRVAIDSNANLTIPCQQLSKVPN